VFSIEVIGSGFSNPQSEIHNPKFFTTWLGYRKQENVQRSVEPLSLHVLFLIFSRQKTLINSAKSALRGESQPA
jgi:hypothetical protein